MVKVASAELKTTGNIKNVLKGSITSILISLILLFNFAAILTYTKVSERTMPVIVIIITCISILIGSQFATSKMKKSGIFYGAIVGIIYILFLYLLSSIITKNFSLSTYGIVMAIVAILAGSIGGIIGINRRK